MKRLKRFVFLYVLIAVSLFRANAKIPVSFGLKMEANVHEFWLYDLDCFESRKGVAPSLGFFLKTGLNDALAIQTELSLFCRNTGVKICGRDDYFRQRGLCIPVYLVRNEYIDNSIWYFGIGPYVQIGFDAHMKEAAEAPYGNVSVNRLDCGIGAILGCEFHSGIQFNAALQLGIREQLQIPGKEPAAMNKTVMVGIGYRF
ncbi:MAG: hypothetical protein LBJ47_00635 [Tannerella sp.]|jgi:hypothetical protein|nr:hypothetical protein [Tannerella sp.]